MHLALGMVAARSSDDLIWTLFLLCWLLYSSLCRQAYDQWSYDHTTNSLRLSSSWFSSPNRKRTCRATHPAISLREDMDQLSLATCILNNHCGPGNGVFWWAILGRVYQCCNRGVSSSDGKPPWDLREWGTLSPKEGEEGIWECVLSRWKWRQIQWLQMGCELRNCHFWSSGGI